MLLFHLRLKIKVAHYRRLRRAPPSWSLGRGCFPMRLPKMKGQANAAELVLARRAHLGVNGTQRTTAVLAVSACGPATGVAGRILQMPHFNDFTMSPHQTLSNPRPSRPLTARKPNCVSPATRIFDYTREDLEPMPLEESSVGRRIQSLLVQGLAAVRADRFAP